MKECSKRRLKSRQKPTLEELIKQGLVLRGSQLDLLAKVKMTNSQAIRRAKAQ